MIILKFKKTIVKYLIKTQHKKENNLPNVLDWNKEKTQLRPQEKGHVFWNVQANSVIRN